MPRSRGGPTSWENVVACCKSCNAKKRDRTPDEARMHLLRQPYAPRFIFALPSARYCVMGGQQAAKTILDIQAAQLKRRGLLEDDEALEDLKRSIEASYAEALNIRYAGARLWVDEIVLPAERMGGP